MRSILMVSAALLMGTGIAHAQQAAPADQPPPPPANQASAPPPAEPGMPPKHHHHDWKKGPLPDDAPPGAFLHMAKHALAHHDYAKADDALSKAETRLLTRAVPQDAGIPPDQSPVVKEIEQARQALRSHDPDGATQATDAALAQLRPPPPGAMPGDGGATPPAPPPSAAPPIAQ